MSDTSLQDEQAIKVMGPTLRLGAVILVLCASLFGAAAVLDHGSAVKIPAGATRVTVTLSNFGIAYAPSTSLPHGTLAFVVTNSGSVPHELVMFETSLPAGRLPLRKDGDVNEESSLMRDVVDSGPSLAPGQTKVFVATLAAGHYVAVCNLPGHYRLGMRLDVTVR